MGKIQVLNNSIRSMKPGSPVWWLDSMGSVREGVMRAGPSALFEYPEYGSSVMLTGSELKNCWPTKQECLNAEKQRRDEQTKAYEDAMCSTGTLVGFLWEHMDKEDKEAVMAVKHRARALLGIELEGE